MKIYLFHAGAPLELVLLDGGGLKRVVRGLDLPVGMQPQALVPSGTWQASRVMEDGDFSWLTCVVIPAFSFTDFELGQRKLLIEQFPEHVKTIERFTR